jgi:hypothetical protein
MSANTTLVFFRCNSGHYFRQTHCPLDGWSTGGIIRAHQLAESLARSDDSISIEALKHAGVPVEVLHRTLVIEFGATTAVFDAIEPDALVVHGERVLLRDLPSSLK